MEEKFKKIEKKKAEKENKLLETALKLFTEKGVKNTSIQDIVDNAGVAKGTFYLYFKDKYDIRDQLIKKTSQKLFREALESLEKSYIKSFEDQIIFIINYVIDELNKNKILLQFIAKDLSWGVFNKNINRLSSFNTNETILDSFILKVKENNISLKNPRVTLYMIIELVGSTCFNSILHKEPLPIEEYKPHLYDIIRKMLKE